MSWDQTAVLQGTDNEENKKIGTMIRKLVGKLKKGGWSMLGKLLKGQLEQTSGSASKFLVQL